MAVFIELTTDLFSQVFEENSDGLRRARRAGSKSVRRPLRGLEIKDDTYAIFKVIDVAGHPMRMFDSSAYHKNTGVTEGTEYANFILQSVQEARMEKHQIVETFGEDYIFFFGESPRFLDVSAVVLNSNDFNWEAEWWANYDAYWRGSKLTELGARLYLFYDDTIIEGYMLNAQAVKTAQEPLLCQMSFRLFVTNYTNISFVDSDDFPIRGSVDSTIVEALGTTSGAAGLAYLANRASVERGLAQEQATIALQKAAFTKFGGGQLLADALRRGLSPAMGPQLGGGAGFGFSARASASVSASAGIGVGVGASAGISAGGMMGASAQAFGGGNMGTPIYSTGSYSGFSPAGLPSTGNGVSFGYSYQASVSPGGTFSQTSTTSDGVTTVNTAVNGQPVSSVTGLSGQGIYAPSPFYPSPTPGMPFAGAAIGFNSFAPNPFASRPFAPNAFGVNPYFPSPSVLASGPRDSTVGPGYKGIVSSGNKQTPAQPPKGMVRTTPLRSKIWDNIDEWTGMPVKDNAGEFPELRKMIDVEDLPYAAFLMLGAYGAKLSGRSSLNALGMGPRFGSGGVGIGAGASASIGASFGLSAGVSAGVSAGFGFSASAGASFSAGASAGIGANGPYTASYSTSSVSARASAGTPYPNYPGYGAGFGSGSPGLASGYAPGASFGVGARAGVGIGASFGGVGGGAAVMVGGAPTCFCLDSFPGTIRVGGGAFLSSDGVVTTTSYVSGPDGTTFTQRTL